jgi:hypothetical protein
VEGHPEGIEFSLVPTSPTPAISRPPDILSIVASILAVATGLRYGTINTDTPSPMRVVFAAINDSATNGS